MIKLKNILNESILTSRRSREDRLKYHRAHIYKKIKQYIKNGCKGHLYLYNAPIEYLPDELKYVGGSLDLSDSKIKSLPDGLEIKGRLYLSNTPMTSLPSGLEINGNLDLESVAITTLPNGLQVNGWLDLSNTQITSLPDGLEIRGSLYLSNTPLSEKYTEDQIKQIIIDKGGSVKGGIWI